MKAKAVLAAVLTVPDLYTSDLVRAAEVSGEPRPVAVTRVALVTFLPDDDAFEAFRGAPAAERVGWHL